MFESGTSHVCEKAVGPAKTYDFRSGRARSCNARYRTRENACAVGQRQNAVAGEIHLKKGRPFSAFLVKATRRQIGFEFEAREPGARVRGKAAAPGALRVLGKHPEDGEPVSIYSGRYGPYVKHGGTNATIKGQRPGREDYA